ncbi:MULTISPECIES: hypothetical protein [Shewanella]|uniref:Rap1a immunity protein domain-containing protein n=1 Tax=Shewanella japonica TaxID=93973 RepID=A0ABN4Y9Q2_9GAMM|nr:MULTISPECIES: hypothetical protein [Shewanella]ARD21156.1 hypothetical protein SJ2017_0822 [Shewanella japonica]KPZ73452.1 hypothetical protein AN944_00036 [Shewanella sp. P1-14-1]MBQ4890444.1 hypothetical protein [Shewanella sp. MMG014]OBT07034.1 hypothetical protein A9267_14265 [Shewanella sp. UCD-FRSSP16_17]
MRIIQLLALLTFTLTFSLSAVSSNAKNEEQLVLSSCLSVNKTASEMSTQACSYYIQGFLAGSFNTSQQYELKNTSGGFTDRAYRTRVGKQTSKILPTEVCIPANETKEQLVGRIVDRTIEQLSPTTDSLQGLHSQIYQAIANESSCEQQD